MTLLKSRLERLERNLRFKEWLSVQRIFDTWTDDELEAYATRDASLQTHLIGRVHSMAAWTAWTGTLL